MDLNNSESKPNLEIEGCIQKTLDGDLLLAIEVQPNSSRAEITGINMWRGRLQVAVKAPALRGAANSAVVVVLSENIGISKDNLEITQGQTSRQKMIQITGIEAATLVEKIDSIITALKKNDDEV